MKKWIVLLIMVSLLLGACSQQATPTATDAEMQTKVAQILTNMPTVTGQAPKGVTPTPSLGAIVTVLPSKAADATKAATAVGNPTTAPTTAANQAATPTTAAATATATPAVTNTVKATTAPTTAATTAPTATLAASDPKTKLGAATWTDKMNDGDNWPTGIDPSGYTEIGFSNGFMELTGLKPIDGWRLTFDRLANAYVEMTVTTGSCLPKDRYGLILRVPSVSDANRGYMVGFTCDGMFAIRKWDGPAKSMTNFISWKTNAAIAAGANKTNRMGIMMKGNKLSLYANGTLLGEVLDNTWSQGSFGIFAGAHESTSFTLKVDEISYWDLP